MIRKIENILTNEQRVDLIKKCKPFLTKIPNCPAIQTYPHLHQVNDLVSFYEIFLKRIENELKLNVSIFKSWVNEDVGRKEDIHWHTHDNVDYTCVYYMKTIPFFNSGTLFEDGFIRSKQNSMLIFPGNVLHGTPSYPFRFIKRYSLVIDLIVKK